MEATQHKVIDEDFFSMLSSYLNFDCSVLLFLSLRFIFSTAFSTNSWLPRVMMV